MISRNYDLAIAHYDRNDLDFFEELNWHHDNGWVINIPNSFGMGFFYKENDKIVLFVSYVNGDMPSLLRFSLNLELDFIEFKRNFCGDVKRYDYNKFLERFCYG